MPITRRQYLRALGALGTAAAVATAGCGSRAGASGGADRRSTERTEPSPEAAATTAGGSDRARLERLIHERINGVRESEGLPTLAVDPELREIARYHSRDMAERGYFAHTAPDGETMRDRYDRFGYECRVSTGDGRYAIGAENIYRQSASTPDDPAGVARSVVAGWMDSPPHRENILREYWQHEGIGVAVVEDGTTQVFVTQNFC